MVSDWSTEASADGLTTADCRVGHRAQLVQDPRMPRAAAPARPSEAFGSPVQGDHRPGTGALAAILLRPVPDPASRRRR